MPSSSPKDPELVALGARLRRCRDAAGMTQEALADAADMHFTYVGQIERGERNVGYRKILRLAQALGVSPGSLVDPDAG